MITYAQNFEDVMLARVFPERVSGFYVDVGAGDPEYLSVTKWFYDLGWSGINIEPNRSLYAKLAAARPRDINLACALGAAAGSAQFFEAASGEFSTLDAKIAEGRDCNTVARTVDVVSLTSILQRHGAGRQIDFLKIDVEGCEHAVLSGLDLRRYRPTVIVVAARAPRACIETALPWEHLLIENRYLEVYFDGLNKFYIPDDRMELTQHFVLPPNVFDKIVDGRSLRENRQLQREIAEKDGEIAALGSFQAQLDKRMEGMKGEVDRLMKGEADRLEKRLDELTERFDRRLNELMRLLTKPGLSRRLDRRLNELMHLLTKPSLPRHLFRRITLPRRIWRRLMRDFRPILFTPRQHRPRPLRIPASYAREIAPRDPPAITIVTPSFNQGRFIATTIDSVLSQNYPKLRYLVEDGDSADNTVDVLRRYGSRVEWASKADRGQAHAVNRGFARSSDAEIMAYLNSDDILLPGALAYVVNAFARDPEIDLVYGHRIFIDDQGMEIGRCILPEHDPEALQWADYVPQETLFWRRRVWQAVGPLDETFSFALDWDFLLRAQKAGFRLRRLPRFLAAFRVHDGQKTWSWVQLGEQEMSRLRERSFGRKVTPDEINRNISSYLSRHIAINFKWRYGLSRF
jgi:FkbM family methyltransferase